MTQSTLPSLRIIFFSNQPPPVVNGVIEGLQALGQQVPLLVTTAGPRRRPNQNFHLIVANAHRDLDVLVTNHLDRLPALLRMLEPDLIFTAGFPWKLPPALLGLPRLGCINAHPALLPKYRGPEPLFWQLMNGEKQTGLTIHRMDAEFDTGPILVQRAIDIAEDDDIDSIFVKLLPLSVPMIPLALASVARGDPGVPQPEEGSYAPIPTAADRQLDWSRSAVELRNQVRAWGRMGAFAGISGRTFLVHRARVISPSLESQRGILLDNSEGGLLVQTGHDALLIQDFEEVV